MTNNLNKTTVKQRPVTATNEFESRLFKRFEELAKQEKQSRAQPKTNVNSIFKAK